MKMPAPPPPDGPDSDAWAGDLEGFVAALSSVRDQRRYLPWNDLRFRATPDGMSPEQWWAAVRFIRRRSARSLAQLRDSDGTALSYVLADELLEGVERITARASGQILLPEEVTNTATRDRYVVSSLIEESITSSQLEGAATTRLVAKEMIRSGRPPTNHGERMIANNFRAMQRISELRETPLSPEHVLEIHRLVSEGTLKDPGSAGRLQESDAERVAVHGEFGELLHAPPPVAELPARLKQLCAFANGHGDHGYVHPVLRAVAVHFMVGYDHYFEDGNGRTARALFYWVMLREGYWLTEYLTISRLLKKAPSQYARSFLHTEIDDGDLTHFFVYHVGVINRAIDALHEYLADKASEMDRMRLALAGRHGDFNHRQLAVLDHAVRQPQTTYTVHSHALSHHVSGETARKDLSGLADKGLLQRMRQGKHFAWVAVPDLAARLQG
jgi:Fic family protein